MRLVGWYSPRWAHAMPTILTLAQRRAKLLELLIRRGPLSIAQMQDALGGVTRSAVEQAVACRWFVRVVSGRRGRGARYDLTDLGREEVRRAG